MKKILSITMTLIMLLAFGSVSAENDTVQLIINIGTTQAFGEELVEEDDLVCLLPAPSISSPGILQSLRIRM